MKILLFLIFLFIMTFSCANQKVQKVQVKKTDSGYQLFRSGQPYFIKGAGANGHYKLIAEYGGNSIRTWGIPDWDEAFAYAEKHNLTVCAGMWLEQERQGFDYNDEEAVKKQFEYLKKAILKYKDHPSLLVWGIGNELNLSYKNPKVWDAIEDVARFIHEVDGNHPTMTVTTFMGQEEIDYIKERCPSIDILGINVFAALPVLSKFLSDFGWDRPYIATEWGTFGHWEVQKTSWDEPIELNSTEKAAFYKKGYKEHIKDVKNCLGSYVFFWGNKQERTATWYSMFLPTGEKTEVVDVMHYSWSGSWPSNRAPKLEKLTLDGRKAADNIILRPGSKQKAFVAVSDSEKDSLKIVWEIRHETTDKKEGGDEEQKPEEVPGLIIQKEKQTLKFKAPEDEGPYRLFVYVYDQEGSAAHANIPFFVKNE